MYHSVLTKLSCFSSPWWLCCPVTTPPDHHHQNTHKEGGHKVSWLKDPSKNEQKHSRESWPGLRQNPEPYSYLCLHQGLWRRSILTARARQSLPVLAQNVWMPASVRWETCNLQSSKSQPCLHVWSVIHRRPSKICTPELPPRGSRRFLDLTVTISPFHHSNPGQSKQTDPSDTNSVCVTQQTIPTQPCYRTVKSVPKHL